MKVTVIIPNYNGLKFMEVCMKALEKQTYKDFEIIFVDNASSDNSVEYMSENYPEVKRIIMSENTGFSSAVNVGIKASNTPYVILLNNDTEVDKNYIKALVEAMDLDKRIFSASSKMIQYHNRELIDDAGDMYSILGWAYQRGVGHSVNGYDKPCKVFSACAGAAIYRRELFEIVGYFDEMHFAYLEDIDVGYRARLYGYLNVYEPKAIVYHVGSGTSGSKYNDFKVKLAARNSIYLNYKNMPALQLLFNSFPLAVGFLIKWNFFKKNGFGDTYIAGIKEGIASRHKCKKVKLPIRQFKNYIIVEFELIVGTFIYVKEFIIRKSTK